MNETSDNEKHIVLNDNSRVEEKKYSSTLLTNICDQTLASLEKNDVLVFPSLRDAEDLEKKQVIVSKKDREYRTYNIMGFLGCREERLTIRSRFTTGDDDFFFKHMLAKVFDVPNLFKLNIGTEKDGEFELLLFYFIFLLRKAMRKGIYKIYVRNQYNDGNPKGTIDIARHIKLNTPFIGKIAYNQREFSYDNHVTQLIRHTIEFIKAKPYGRDLLRSEQENIDSLVYVTQSYRHHDRFRVIAQNTKQPVSHAYYHEYRELQRVCIAILRLEKHGIAGNGNEMHGILFDGAWLWEEYLNTVIGDDFYHPRNKAKGGESGAQRLFVEDLPDSDKQKKIGLIYPDFIGRDSGNPIIADAKYKPIGNIGRGDYHQILTYMFRFESKRGYFLYPDSKETGEQTLHLQSGTTYKGSLEKRDITVTKLGFTVPSDAKSSEDFSKRMEEEVERFKGRIVDLSK